jgi:hypothetical protein
VATATPVPAQDEPSPPTPTPTLAPILLPETGELERALLWRLILVVGWFVGVGVFHVVASRTSRGR